MWWKKVNGDCFQVNGDCFQVNGDCFQGKYSSS